MKPVLKYAFFAAGLIIATKMAVFFLHAQFTGFGRMSGLASLFLLILPLSIAFIQKKKENGGFLTLKQLMRTGLGICLLASLLVGLFNFLYFRFIDLEIINYYLEENARYMRSINQSETEIQTVLEKIKEFYSPMSQATGTLIGVLGAGALISFFMSPLIVKNPPAVRS